MTVVVAMSGGVDSSVVACMLKEQGHEVIGITLRLYDTKVDLKRKGACCAGQDIYDASTVARQIGIKHYVLDYESVFKQDVIEDFVDSYMEGRTPIPCITCNQTVKFRDLMRVAKDLKADFLATGHYVQRIVNESGTAELHTGVDPKKDQSYFLFHTTQEQLDFLRFPLGCDTKEKTRELARKYSLKISDKPDSQDICFVPNGSYRDIVTKLRPGALDPGNLLDMSGNIVGQHSGIINFTIGQRRGLNVAMGMPMYVIDINPETKDVIIGPEEYLYSNSCIVSYANWLSDGIPSEGASCCVRLRSSHRDIRARVYMHGQDKVKVELEEEYKGITPGQACVMYDGTRVLGGGYILQ